MKRSVRIVNKRGLHARASAKFVECTRRFGAEIRVRRNGQIVDGSSIMDLMMLAAPPGAEIVIEAKGEEALEALEALCALVANHFDEA